MNMNDQCLIRSSSWPSRINRNSSCKILNSVFKPNGKGPKTQIIEVSPGVFYDTSSDDGKEKESRGRSQSEQWHRINKSGNNLGQNNKVMIINGRGNSIDTDKLNQEDRSQIPMAKSSSKKVGDKLLQTKKW